MPQQPPPATVFTARSLAQIASAGSGREDGEILGRSSGRASIWAQLDAFSDLTPTKSAALLRYNSSGAAVLIGRVPLDPPSFYLPKRGRHQLRDQPFQSSPANPLSLGSHGGSIVTDEGDPHFYRLRRNVAHSPLIPGYFARASSLRWGARWDYFQGYWRTGGGNISRSTTPPSGVGIVHGPCRIPPDLGGSAVAFSVPGLGSASSMPTNGFSNDGTYWSIGPGNYGGTGGDLLGPVVSVGASAETTWPQVEGAIYDTAEAYFPAEYSVLGIGAECYFTETTTTTAASTHVADSSGRINLGADSTGAAAVKTGGVVYRWAGGSSYGYAPPGTVIPAGASLIHGESANLWGEPWKYIHPVTGRIACGLVAGELAMIAGDGVIEPPWSSAEFGGWPVPPAATGPGITRYACLLPEPVPYSIPLCDEDGAMIGTLRGAFDPTTCDLEP